MHWKERIAVEFNNLDEEGRAHYRYAQEKLTKLVDRDTNDAIIDPALKTEEGWETWLHIAAMLAAKHKIYAREI